MPKESPPLQGDFFGTSGSTKNCHRILKVEDTQSSLREDRVSQLSAFFETSSRVQGDVLSRTYTHDTLVTSGTEDMEDPTDSEFQRMPSDALLPTATGSPT
jgi:hypothetical protein